MGLPSRQPVHARHRDGPDRRHDPRKAADLRPYRKLGLHSGLTALLLALAAPAAAETLRLAVWNVELTRRGPGLLLRDIEKGTDPQVAAVVRVLIRLDADVLLLVGMDWDHDLVALDALADRLARAGLRYPYLFATRPNTGMATGLDLDANGRLGEPRDAQGYGRFAGEGGMAILSRLPVDAAAARDFTAMPWRDLPGALIPDATDPGVVAVQRLSTTAHWDVPLTLPDGRALHLLAWAATPPVFDGPEDRNGRRNHDESAFWLRLLDGDLPLPPPPAPFVMLGQASLDPVDGDGRPGALRALLDDRRLQDTAPRATWPVPAEAGQRGDPALDTAIYPKGVGGLRVDYVLPSAGLTVAASGVMRPAPGDPQEGDAALASRHFPVWVDLTLP